MKQLKDKEYEEKAMKALIINCSPVRTGATAEIVDIIEKEIYARYDTKCICIDDYDFGFCKGCRNCHNTAKCVMDDDITKIMDEFDNAEVIISGILEDRMDEVIENYTKIGLTVVDIEAIGEWRGIKLQWK